MPVITLHHFKSPQRKIRMEFNDISAMHRESDHGLPPVGPLHFTVVRLRQDCRTSEGKNIAQVKETESEIKTLAARARDNQFRL